METTLEDAAAPTLEHIRNDIERTSPRIAKMLEYMAENLFEPSLNVSTLKKALDLRDNSVAVLFHKTVGVPPKLYINQRRYEVAARLLVSTELSVWRIGEMVGFNSLGVFSKGFARVVGIRPKRYRRQNQEPQGTRRTSVPGFYSPDELAAALAGTLPTPRVQTLVESILRAYPDLAIDA